MQEFLEVSRRLGAANRKQAVPTVEPVALPKPVNPSKCKRYSRKIVTAWMESAGIPAPSFEHKFHPTRKWRFDLAWPVALVAMEVQGGLWNRGRHTQGAALVREYEKLSEAACYGWRVLLVQPQDLLKQSTAELIIRALAGKG